jgi:hypothetical protein
VDAETGEQVGRRFEAGGGVVVSSGQDDLKGRAGGPDLGEELVVAALGAGRAG